MEFDSIKSFLRLIDFFVVGLHLFNPTDRLLHHLVDYQLIVYLDIDMACPEVNRRVNPMEERFILNNIANSTKVELKCIP
jgi:hypothetical protein